MLNGESADVPEDIVVDRSCISCGLQQLPAHPEGQYGRYCYVLCIALCGYVCSGVHTFNSQVPRGRPSLLYQPPHQRDSEGGRKRGVLLFGHVMRREEHCVGRRAMEIKVQGRRKRGRPKRRWLDNVKDDIKEKGLSADEVYDSATWRRMSSYIDPT